MSEQDKSRPGISQMAISIPDLMAIIGEKEVRIQFLTKELNKVKQELASTRTELEKLRSKKRPEGAKRPQDRQSPEGS